MKPKYVYLNYLFLSEGTKAKKLSQKCKFLTDQFKNLTTDVFSEK